MGRGMITFSDRIYCDNISEKKIDLIKLGIKQGRGRLKLFLIALSNNDSDQLDIFHNSLLKQRLFRKLDLRIVGFADSKDEAIGIVQNMLDETIEQTGTCNIKAYLIDKYFVKD